MKRAKIARASRQKTPHKQTNFDRITASPEALAEYLGCGCCAIDIYDCLEQSQNCGNGILKWLKEEAK